MLAHGKKVESFGQIVSNLGKQMEDFKGSHQAWLVTATTYMNSSRSLRRITPHADQLPEDDRLHHHGYGVMNEYRPY